MSPPTDAALEWGSKSKILMIYILGRGALPWCESLVVTTDDYSAFGRGTAFSATTSRGLYDVWLHCVGNVSCCGGGESTEDSINM